MAQLTLTMVQANYIIEYGDEKNSHEICEILNMVIRRLRYTPGCMQSDLWRNDDQHAVMISEIWKTKADFNRHVNSSLFKRTLSALELAPEKPVVRISECENVRGIDLLEEVMTNFNISFYF